MLIVRSTALLIEQIEQRNWKWLSNAYSALQVPFAFVCHFSNARTRIEF